MSLLFYRLKRISFIFWIWKESCQTLRKRQSFDKIDSNVKQKQMILIQNAFQIWNASFKFHSFQNQRKLVGLNFVRLKK